jgi:hypothetical protein
VKRPKPGDRVFVVLDCRDQPTATEQYATYQGRCWIHNGRRYRGPREHLFEVNPLLTLDDGSKLWGYQCWWVPLDHVKELERLVALRDGAFV